MKPKKILLVDDSTTALMMEKMLLNAEPYEIMIAKNGREELLGKVRSYLATCRSLS